MVFGKCFTTCLYPHILSVKCSISDDYAEVCGYFIVVIFSKHRKYFHVNSNLILFYKLSKGFLMFLMLVSLTWV